MTADVKLNNRLNIRWSWTIRVLAVNHPDAVKLRRQLIAERVFPPEDCRALGS